MSPRTHAFYPVHAILINVRQRKCNRNVDGDLRTESASDEKEPFARLSLFCLNYRSFVLIVFIFWLWLSTFDVLYRTICNSFHVNHVLSSYHHLSRLYNLSKCNFLSFVGFVISRFPFFLTFFCCSCGAFIFRCWSLFVRRLSLGSTICNQ